MAEIDALERLVTGFCDRARVDLARRLERWPTDLSKSEVHEVVGALLARQVTLASQIASAPSTWNGHAAPLLLRAMADVHITAVWIFNDPAKRAKQYVLYGLGQQKLQLEHRRAHLSPDAPPEEKEHLDALEAWINQQRVVWLTEVNVGSWAGVTTRRMAEEAGCIDFYNFVYAPFSGCAHSMWQHVAAYNLRECQNPLHRMHSVAHVPDLPLDPHYLHLAGKYLQKTLAAFDEFAGITLDLPSAFEMLCDDLAEFEGDSEN